MLSLVGKDLRAIALPLCLIVPTLGLPGVGALLAGQVYLVLSCAIAANLVAVAPAIEWSVGADPFVHSLPVSRVDVVKARYAASLLLAAGCLALAASTAVVFASSVVGHGSVWPAWVALETALAAAIYVSVYIAVFLGCVFRFGTATGGVVSALAIAVLIPLGARYVKPEALAKLMEAMGTVPAAVGVMLAMALLIWLSMRISMRCHERREF
jgi:hypothetical protein